MTKDEVIGILEKDITFMRKSESDSRKWGEEGAASADYNYRQGLEFALSYIRKIDEL